jgi:TPP-dependent pyruvate/acetoin dehydrogenase alpha subunit
MASHSSSDDAARYRDPAAFAQWQQRDPIERFRRYLEHRGLWDAAFEAECVDGQKAALQQAIAEVDAGPDPIAATLFDDVYMNLTPQLREQRDELRTLMAQGGGGAEIGHFPL